MAMKHTTTATCNNSPSLATKTTKRYKSNIFGCRPSWSLPSFLRRTHAAHRHNQRSSATTTTTTTTAANAAVEVHIHTLPKTTKHVLAPVYSYTSRCQDGLPCPSCHEKMFTPQGLWIHLSTTIADHLRPVALTTHDGAIHMALTRRPTGPPSALLLQSTPACMMGESEVIYWQGQGQEWRSKRYYPQGRVLVPLAPGPLVVPQEQPPPTTTTTTTTTTQQQSNSNNNNKTLRKGNSNTMDNKAATDDVMTTTTTNNNKRGKASRKYYFAYNDIIPLKKALQQQKPPKRTYFHATSLRPVTIGEWMLEADQRRQDHPLATTRAWRKRVDDAVLQDFDDVDDVERDFIQQWNRAIQTRVLVTDRDTALICRHVLQQSNGNIPEKVWMAHLLNLWDERQLGRDDMLILMREYHEQRHLRSLVVGVTDEEDV